MKPLTPQDLWPLPVYEQCRDAFRREVIAAKRARRISVGPKMTFVFENRMTVKFQLQEVIRVERIQKQALITEELEAFNSLLPRRGELSSTLLIELTNEAEVQSELAQLVGLSKSVWIRLDAEAVAGVFEAGREEAQRISAVQYVRFPLGSAARLLEATKVTLVVDHPYYRAQAPLTQENRRSLAEDLA